MPDIATALETAIQQWENNSTANIKPSLFQPTNNISRTTFETIRDNPGIDNIGLLDVLQPRGYNRNSVSSLVSQMVRQNMVQRNEAGQLRALVPEYRPLKTNATLRNAERRRQKKEAYERRIATRKANQAARRNAVIAAAASQATPAPAPATQAMQATQATPATQVSADAILNSLSVLQARELYSRLKDIFGG